MKQPTRIAVQQSDGSWVPVDVALEATQLSVLAAVQSKLITVPYNTIKFSYTATTDILSFKVGSTVVATLTVAYIDVNKDTLDQISVTYP